MQREDSLPVFSADEDKSIDHEGKYYVIVLAINGLRYVHIRVHLNRRLLMKNGQNLARIHTTSLAFFLDF